MKRGEVRSPIRWMGGKEQLAKRIVAELPTCEAYVEPFGGAASVLFARPAQQGVLEVYNDLHKGVVNLFRVLREHGEELYRRLELTPYSCDEYHNAIRWEEEKDSIERARRFFVLIRQGFNGLTKASGWGRSMNVKCVHGWVHAIERMPAILQRLKNVQIECTDWRDVCERYDHPETLIYMDPPYVLSTRMDPTIYDFEFTDSQHEELLDFMLNSISMIALSGYVNETYMPLEANGWKRIDWFVLCYGGSTNKGERKRTWRVESLWLNPLLQHSKRLEA